MKQWQKQLEELEKQYGLPPGMLYGLAMTESSGNPLATNKNSTAKGLFQYLDGTAKERKIDPYDPIASATQAAKDLRNAYDTLGGWDKAVLAHHYGIAGVKKGATDDRYLAKVAGYAEKPFGIDAAPNNPQGGEKGIVRPKPTKGVSQEEVIDPTEGMTGFEKFFAGVGSGMNSTVQGVKQTATGLGTNVLDAIESMFPDAQWVRTAAENARKLREQVQKEGDDAAALDRPLLRTGAGLTGNITGQVALTAPIPVGGLGTAAKATTALAKGAGLGAVNALTSFREGDEGIPEWWAKQIAGGAVGNEALYGLGKVANAGLGRFRNYTTDTGRPDSVAVYRSAKDKDIPVSIGDIDPTSMWHRWENFTANLPLTGRRTFMKKQAEATAGALREFNESARPATMKQGDSGFDDPGQVIYDAIRKEYKTRKDEAGRLFDKVNEAAKAEGVTPVDATNTKAAIDGIESRFGDLLKSFGDSKLTNAVRGIKGMTDQDAIEKYGPISFTDMRTLRTLVGEKIREMENRVRSGSGGESQYGALKNLYEAIEGDIRAWGTKGDKSEEVFQKFMDASKYYKDKIDPYKRVPLLNEIRLLPDHSVFDYDRLLSAVAGKDRPNRAELILGQAAPEGQEAAVHYLINKATEAGLDPNVEGGMAASQFLKSLDLGRTRDVVFNKRAQDVADMENVVRATRRASAYTKDNGTGTRLTPAQMAAAMTGLSTPMVGMLVGGMPGGATGAGIAGAALGSAKLSNLYSATDIGKRLHLADPKQLPFKIPGPVSDEDQYLLKYLSRAMPTAFSDYMVTE